MASIRNVSDRDVQNSSTVIKNVSKGKTNESSEDIDISYLLQAGFPLFFNIVVLVLIISRRKLISKKSNKLFINLLVVHILLCISGIVSKFHMSVGVVIFSNGCLIELFLSLILITSDRCVNIKFPFEYHKINTKKVILMITSSWVITAIFVILYIEVVTNGYYRVVISTILLGFATFTLTLSNITIYIIARRHVNAIRRNTSLESMKNRKRVLKSTYVCFSIILSFVISWLPYFVHNVMTLVKAYIPGGYKLFTKVVVRVAMVNSLIDPFLYLCFNRDVKKELKKIMAKKDERKRKNVIIDTHRSPFLETSH